MPTPRRSSAQRSRPRRTRARLEVGERRAQLVSLGLMMFATRSYDDVSMDDLAHAAGISKALLYHYFPTKRHYYVAVLDHAARELLRQTLVPTEGLLPAERLQRGLETYFDFVERHGPAFVALMRGGVGSDPEVAAVLERTRSTFVARILEYVPKKHATPLLRIALRGWIGFVEAVAIEWVTRRAVGRAQLLELTASTLVGTVQSASGYSLL